jgi:glutathione peroxidase
MKIIIVVVIILAIGAVLFWKYRKTLERPADARSTTSIYDYTATSIDGKAIPLSTFRGKKILIVNVASRCGFTPQYEELEQLSKEYAEHLVVLGFPSNDFLGQEPGTNEEIASFCRLSYGVTFPMMTKSSVTGEGRNDVFRWLTDKNLNGWNEREPKWNFYKYLVSDSGELLKVFPSAVRPMSEELLTAVRK